MFARYASAVTSGTLMTFALLFVMQLLISLQPGAEREGREKMVLGLVTVRPDTIIEERAPEIIKDDLTKTVTPPNRLQPTSSSEAIRVPREQPKLPPGNSGINLSQPLDGALVNMFRVSPVYPIRAQSMGLEGHVIVQFDVDAFGHVTNPVVVESSHRIFEKSAVRAALAFRYKPRVVDGVALETRGIRNLFTFTMDD